MGDRYPAFAPAVVLGWRLRLGVVALAVAVLFSLGMGAGSASAQEAFTEAPTELVPAPTDPDEMGPNATPDRLRCQTGGGFGYIRNEPNKYVIGNCLNNIDFFRARCNSAVCSQSFGYAFGNYQGCGWIASQNAQFISDADHGNCIRGSIAINEFARLLNCAPETCADGSQVTIQRNCGMYANARPFTTTSGLDFLRTRPAGYQVFWRYVSRDNGYVMVRDPNVGTGQGNWAFVQRSCLPALSGSPVA
jgi:hypothetical protein